MITKDNYEAMLLQYHENLLDRRLREEVEAFLRQNPDIEQEYRQYYSCEPIVPRLYGYGAGPGQKRTQSLSRPDI